MKKRNYAELMIRTRKGNVIFLKRSRIWERRKLMYFLMNQNRQYKKNNPNKNNGSK